MKKSQEQTAPFDLLVFVGRFQPPHKGHFSVIQEALSRAKRVLVLVGSANRSRSLRDPFTFEERAGMLRAACPEHAPEQRIVIAPLNDHLYNDAAWMEEVQSSVATALADIPEGQEKRVGIIGHSKDHTSYYLRIFPGFLPVDVPGFRTPDGGLLHSSDLRTTFYHMLMDRKSTGEWMALKMESLIPAKMAPSLLYILRSPDMAGVIEDARFVEMYREAWASAPYPPTFNTVDAVVVQSGHILMVMRGASPGRGKFALPGGFIGQDETLLTGCMRELYEETQVDIPPRVMLGALRSREARVFDDPHRSSRGRTITHAFRFDLNEKWLPKVQGGDDAASAMWIPLSAVKPEQCFEDHAFIIRAMLEVS